MSFSNSAGFKSRVFIIGLILTASFSSATYSQTLLFRCGGTVGADLDAQGILGTTFGNTGWFVNGNQLEPGDVVEFIYVIDIDAADQNPDTNIGRFGGGTLFVNIPSAGVNSFAVENYEMQLEEDNSGVIDQIRIIQDGDGGLQCTTRWLADVNPFNDVNTLGMLPSPVPTVGDTIGTSEFGQFDMTLNSGDEITTTATELLENPFFIQEVPEQTFEFKCGGFVGSDPNATGVNGVLFGNNGWFVDGNPLEAGDLVEFTYTIGTTNDISADATIGRFSGGMLTVSIPAMGINDVASTDPYDVLRQENLDGVDQIRLIPSDDTGLQCTTRWLDSANPFADVNTLGSLPGPVPAIGDTIGTAEFGDFTMNLTNGVQVSTASTELLENPFLEQEILAPFNDNYFGPQVALPFNIVGSNEGSSTQADEQQLDGTGSTVWYFFVAGESGTVTINTVGSTYDTQLHIYTGFEMGFPNLIPVANNDDTFGLQSQVTFDVEAGECYDIRVGGFRSSGQTGDGAEGCLMLNGVFESAEFLLGDVNCDGVVNLLDVAPFVEIVSGGDFNLKADINEDGQVNLLDVAPFIAILGGG